MTIRRAILGGFVAILLGVGFYAGGGMNILYAAITEETFGDSVDVQTAHQLAQQGDIHLIDIRRPDEWKKTGSGEGATRLDMRRDDFIDELVALTGGDRSAPVALICARGVRSARMTNRLTAAGFTNIIDVPEGMLGSKAGPGWLKSDLPLVKN